MKPTKQTWRLRTMGHDVPAVMASASSLDAAAKTLGVNKSTVFRWVKSGKVPAPGAKREPGIPASPQGWAAAVRAAYDLDATEEALVELAEAALAMARDPALTPMARLAAMARFGQIVRQVDLEVPDGKTQAAGTASRSWPRRVVS